MSIHMITYIIKYFFLKKAMHAHVHTYHARATAALKGHLVLFFYRSIRWPLHPLEEEESSNSYMVIWKCE